MVGSADYEDLISGAVAAPFEGWDFSWIADRHSLGPVPWDYHAIVRARAARAGTMLDMGTGGGEFLASLASLPPVTVATEGHPPNWLVAANRLSEFDVGVVAVGGCPDNSRWAGVGGELPFATGAFDLVINRHEAYSPTEVARVTSPDGVFVTQQVGGRDEAELVAWFDRVPDPGPEWNLAFARAQLESAGFTVIGGEEHYPRHTFFDVGAVAYYLLATPWRVAGFDVEADRHHLERLHEAMTRSSTGLAVTSHRFWLAARPPSHPPAL